MRESVLNRVCNFLTGPAEDEGPGRDLPPLFGEIKIIIISLSSSLNYFFDTRLRIQFSRNKDVRDDQVICIMQLLISLCSYYSETSINGTTN